MPNAVFRERTFRFNLVVVAAVMALACWLGVRLGTRSFVRPSLFFSSWPTDLGMLVATVVLCAVLRWLFVVQVGPDGLRTTDGVGRYHEVRWDAMRRVTNVTGFLWIPHGKLGKALMFPLFLERSAEFRDYVMAHAPAGNPLRTYLERR